MSPHSGEMREEDKIEVAKHFLKKCVVKAVEMEEKELVGGKKKTVWQMSLQRCNIQQNIT